jgi:DNA-binding protein HU-beta
MNKTELINAVSKKAGLSKENGRKAVEAVLQIIFEEVQQGSKVVIVRFGTFSVTERSARKVMSPRTNQVIIVPARKAIKFKAAAAFAKAVE